MNRGLQKSEKEKESGADTLRNPTKNNMKIILVWPAFHISKHLLAGSVFCLRSILTVGRQTFLGCSLSTSFTLSPKILVR